MKIQYAAFASILLGMLSSGVAAQQEPADDTASDMTAAKMEKQVVDLRSIPYLPEEASILFMGDPKEIKAVREAQLREQAAKYQPLREVRPLSDLEVISGTGDKMPIVYVTPEYPTSVLFTDMTGQSWPIRYAGATDTLVEVEQPTGTDNALVLYARNIAGEKSITLFLEGLMTPVTLIVKGSDSQYHAVKNIRITENGPNVAKERLFNQAPSAITKAQAATNTKTTEVLNKLAYVVTPEGFVKLRADRPGVDAWIDKEKPDQIYLRTKYTIAAPGPIGGGAGVTPLQGDVRLYVLPRINPILALNEQGERIYITLREK